MLSDAPYTSDSFQLIGTDSARHFHQMTLDKIYELRNNKNGNSAYHVLPEIVALHDDDAMWASLYRFTTEKPGDKPEDAPKTINCDQVMIVKEGATKTFPVHVCSSGSFISNHHMLGGFLPEHELVVRAKSNVAKCSIRADPRGVVERTLALPKLDDASKARYTALLDKTNDEIIAELLSTMEEAQAKLDWKDAVACQRFGRSIPWGALMMADGSNCFDEVSALVMFLNRVSIPLNSGRDDDEEIAPGQCMSIAMARALGKDLVVVELNKFGGDLWSDAFDVNGPKDGLEDRLAVAVLKSAVEVREMVKEFRVACASGNFNMAVDYMSRGMKKSNRFGFVMTLVNSVYAGDFVIQEGLLKAILRRLMYSEVMTAEEADEYVMRLPAVVQFPIVQSNDIWSIDDVINIICRVDTLGSKRKPAVAAAGGGSSGSKSPKRDSSSMA